MPSPTPPTALPDDIPRGQWINLTSEAPAYTGLSRRTLWRRIKDRTLPAYKVAGTRAIRVNTADLDAMFTPINGAE